MLLSVSRSKTQGFILHHRPSSIPTRAYSSHTGRFMATDTRLPIMEVDITAKGPTVTQSALQQLMYVLPLVSPDLSLMGRTVVVTSTLENSKVITISHRLQLRLRPY